MSREVENDEGGNQVELPGRGGRKRQETQWGMEMISIHLLGRPLEPQANRREGEGRRVRLRITGTVRYRALGVLPRINRSTM